MFAIGAYAGEVVRRARGGEWIGNDSDPQGEIDITLKLPSGGVCWPVQRAIKRFKNGSEDSLYAWGHSLLNPSEKPKDG